MNIKSILETQHSKSSTLKIVNYIGNNKLHFKELITIFFENDYQLTQRSAWPLAEAVLIQPQLITSYLNKLIKKLNQQNNHPAVNRNILKILETIIIPQKYQSQILNSCFKFILNPAQPIATIAFAITLAAKICKPYKELTDELILVLKHLEINPQPPAVKSRIKQAYKLLLKVK